MRFDLLGRKLQNPKDIPTRAWDMAPGIKSGGMSSRQRARGVLCASIEREEDGGIIPPYKTHSAE
jgi:hypothetical protein